MDTCGAAPAGPGGASTSAVSGSSTSAVNGSKSVSQVDFAEHGLPDGGKWFYEQNGALKLLKESKFQGFVVAWDKSANDGNKFYGYFKSLENFHTALIQKGDRCAYELIPEGIPCHLYLDIEWVGFEDYEHLRLKKILEDFAKKANSAFFRDPQFSVACGTRPVKDSVEWKNSYHVVSQDLVFKCNHDGEMLAFIKDVINKDSHWYVQDKCVVDLKVYTRNRCFRTLGSCKKGGTVPFQMVNLSTDALKDNTDDLDDFRSLRVTAPTASFLDIVSFGVPDLSSGSSSKVPKKRTREVHTPIGGAAGAAASGASKQPPFPLSIIKNILVAHGDNATQITKCTPEVDAVTGESSWKFQGYSGGADRPCLISPGTTHKKNNCILFAKQVSAEGYTVQYVCMGGKCKETSHRSLKDLAHVRLDRRSSTWVFDIISEKGSDESESEASEHESEVDADEAEEDNNDPEENTYEKVKARFEMNNAKIMKPFMFLWVDPNNPVEFSLFDKKKFHDFHCEKICWTRSDKEGEDGLVKKDFMKMWFKDENKKIYNKIVMDPRSKDPMCFNLWRGYLCEGLSDHGVDQEWACAPVIEHLHIVVCNRNREHTEWLLDWIANIVQRPYQPSNVAIVVLGKQGSGKNTIFDWLRLSVLGEDHTFQTANPEHECFGQFAMGLKAKTFVHVDETKNLNDKNDRLKNVITCRTIQVEHKGKDAITMMNFVNFYFTSNNEDCFNVAPDDRRMCMFRANEDLRGNKQHFLDLHKHLHTPGVNVSFYNMLKTRDLSKYPYDFSESRPRTALYEEVSLVSITVEKRFLSGIVNVREDVLSFSATDLWNLFCAWASNEKVMWLRVQSKFGGIMRRIHGVTWKRDSRCIIYTIDCSVVRKTLKDAREFDPFVTIMDFDSYPTARIAGGSGGTGFRT